MTAEEARLEVRHADDLRALFGSKRGQFDLSAYLRSIERDVMAVALYLNGGNMMRSARKLGIPRATFVRLVQRYSLQSGTKAIQSWRRRAGYGFIPADEAKREPRLRRLVQERATG